MVRVSSRGSGAGAVRLRVGDGVREHDRARPGAERDASVDAVATGSALGASGLVVVGVRDDEPGRRQREHGDVPPDRVVVERRLLVHQVGHDLVAGDRRRRGRRRPAPGSSRPARTWAVSSAGRPDERGAPTPCRSRTTTILSPPTDSAPPAAAPCSSAAALLGSGSVSGPWAEPKRSNAAGGGTAECYLYAAGVAGDDEVWDVVVVGGGPAGSSGCPRRRCGRRPHAGARTRRTSAVQDLRRGAARLLAGQPSRRSAVPAREHVHQVSDLHGRLRVPRSWRTRARDHDGRRAEFDEALCRHAERAGAVVRERRHRHAVAEARRRPAGLRQDSTGDGPRRGSSSAPTAARAGSRATSGSGRAGRPRLEVELEAGPSAALARPAADGLGGRARVVRLGVPQG